MRCDRSIMAYRNHNAIAIESLTRDRVMRRLCNICDYLSSSRCVLHLSVRIKMILRLHITSWPLPGLSNVDFDHNPNIRVKPSIHASCVQLTSHSLNSYLRMRPARGRRFLEVVMVGRCLLRHMPQLSMISI